jgi:hypothetical protein
MRQVSAVERIAKYLKVMMTDEQLAKLRAIENLPSDTARAALEIKTGVARAEGKANQKLVDTTKKAARKAAAAAKEKEINERPPQAAAESPLPAVEAGDFLTEAPTVIPAVVEKPVTLEEVREALTP